MKRLKPCLWLVVFSLPFLLYGQVEDGFESGDFSNDWGIKSGVLIQTGGAAARTTNFARLLPYTSTTGRELGARFDNIFLDGAKDFSIDYFFRVRSSSQRQFNLQVSDSTGSIGSGAATINLRYQNGWAAYANNVWNTIPQLGSVLDEQWYRVRLTGKNWGAASASYDIELSGPNSDIFTSTATNLAYFQNGNPKTNSARYFVFTTVFGNNPGFDIDEVKAVVISSPGSVSNAILNISGTYPHLLVFNNDGECGIGAVAEWAGKLWFITYPPHSPNGSADKLWSVDTNLNLKAFSGSVGGTHACRMIHRESRQLIIGPYFINTNGDVRVIPPSVMPGRLTSVTRHLTNPENKVYFATMEEGFYEVDVNTLEVNTLYPDVQGTGSSVLPGYHGKGCYTGQSRIIYANNGEPGWSYNNDKNFNGPAGVLAENLTLDLTNGWRIVERKNFTEITSPGGLYGANDTNPIWALGWDKRSVILKVLYNNQWYSYRLPKGSYTHDALHGWYTEWPRIREITNGFYLAHMHGMFYNFPSNFIPGNTAGIKPICTYLKMPVDYCWWNGNLVMTRDDTSTTGNNKWAGQSHSAIWLGKIEDMEKWGSPSGFGGVYMNDDVSENVQSDPFLVYGFSERILHLKLTGSSGLTLRIEYDPTGNGNWQTLTNLSISGGGYVWYKLPQIAMWWVRLVPENNANGLTAYFHLLNEPRRANLQLFDGIADVNEKTNYSDGIIRPKQGNAKILEFAANLVNSSNNVTPVYYEVDGSLVLKATNNPTSESTLRTQYSLDNADFTIDAASVIYTNGTDRFRLPKTSVNYDTPFISGFPRGLREVVTERNLFQAHGTFYEVPRSDAGGFRKIRPISTHNKRISDFASWRGLFVISGVKTNVSGEHIFKADDGSAALWFGNVDDLWQMGEPSGIGGPWKDTQVTALTPSDPYLMFGYGRKVLELSHKSDRSVTFIVEVDFAANNVWSEYGRFTVEPGQTVKYQFPQGYSAHWVRLKTDVDATVSATFYYGTYAPKIGIKRTSDGVMLELNGPQGREFTVFANEKLFIPLKNWQVIANDVFDVPEKIVVDTNLPAMKFYTIKIN